MLQMTKSATNFTTSTTAISRAYRGPGRRGRMSAEVLGGEIEAVQLVVERLLRQTECFARRGCVAPMPPQHFLNQCPFELRHLVGQRSRVRLHPLQQLEPCFEQSQDKPIGDVVQFAHVSRP